MDEQKYARGTDVQPHRIRRAVRLDLSKHNVTIFPEFLLPISSFFIFFLRPRQLRGSFLEHRQHRIRETQPIGCESW